MLAFLGTAYGTILVIWGIVFEVAGIALMWVFSRAIQREEREVSQMTEDRETREEESGGAGADGTAAHREPSMDRERQLVHSRTE